jgi:hypothetical protein
LDRFLAIHVARVPLFALLPHNRRSHCSKIVSSAHSPFFNWLPRELQRALQLDIASRVLIIVGEIDKQLLFTFHLHLLLNIIDLLLHFVIYRRERIFLPCRSNYRLCLDLWLAVD